MRSLKICLWILMAGVLSACGVNPVTGDKEIQFVSEAQEVKMGEQYYAPTRQSQGGDFTVMPELTDYVNEVGQKLAAVADRKLPYEFTVLNSSVPNAWALPGGKIAVNRGPAHRVAERGRAGRGAGPRDRARRGASWRQGAGARHPDAGRHGRGADRRGHRRRRPERGQSRHPGRRRRCPDGAAEIQPRPGAGGRPVRHEVHEGRRLRSLGCRHPAGNLRAPVRERRDAPGLAGRPVRLAPALGRARGAEPARCREAGPRRGTRRRALCGAHEAPARDQAGVRQVRQGDCGGAQEGFRVGEVTDRRGHQAAAARRPLP